MEEREEGPAPTSSFVSMGSLIGLGAALGLLLGTMLGNLMLGMAFGVAAGTVTGAVVEGYRTPRT